MLDWAGETSGQVSICSRIQAVLHASTPLDMIEAEITGERYFSVHEYSCGLRQGGWADAGELLLVFSGAHKHLSTARRYR